MQKMLVAGDAPRTSHEGSLEHIISDRTAVVGIIGLGYVGLPLACTVHSAGFQVIGFDRDENKIAQLKAGKPYIRHIDGDAFSRMVASCRFDPASSLERLRVCNIIIVCLPTPVGCHDEPDMSFVTSAAYDIAQYMQPGSMVVLQSTTYPGATDTLFVEILDAGCRKAGEDYFAAFAPERDDPGNDKFVTSKIPKLVGGVDDVSGRLARRFFCEAGFERVILLSSARVAECAKLMENVYRAVNVALVNELKLVFEGIGVDIWEVLEAASSKPFGYHRFDPGPGIGGHCIPVDPFYLSWKAKESGHSCTFIELAAKINAEMPSRVVARVQAALNEDCKAVKGSKILLVGVAYKREIDDMRNAPALEVWNMLLDLGAQVNYHDPYIPTICPTRKHVKLAGTKSVEFTKSALHLAQYDAVVVLTNHRCFENFDALHGFPGAVIDTRNCVKPWPGLKLIKA